MNQELRELIKGLKYEDGAKLKKVGEFAFLHLSDIKRRTGESYAEHGVMVARTLSEITTDPALLRVVLLHDLFLHPDGFRLMKSSPLNGDEQKLAWHMHQLRRLVINSKTKDLNKVIDSFIADERLFPLRMAHRLSDVRQLSSFEPKLRKQIANETLHMYTALASRLGMHTWRYEMEDTCFAIVHPNIAKKLQKQFDDLHDFDQECLRETQKFLEERLEDKGINCHIDGRVKGLYSTYRKIVLKGRPFEELTDRLALRVIVDDLMDCYRTLGVVHTFMHPIPGKLKDYIGAPKENSYQSIHTVVYPLAGVTEQPIEIQIRTGLMNELCENGAAAHGDYKQNRYAVTTGIGRVSLFRNLAHLKQSSRTPRQFETALRRYFAGDQIAVFDADDNMYHLKSPASALDFITHAYPLKYKKVKLIRINGRKASPDVRLKDGDVVSAEFGKKVTVRKS